jgi:hypothetical protein
MNMTEYDPAVVDIYTRYKHGELNKEEATELLRPHFGPNEERVISVFLSVLTRHNVVDFKIKRPMQKSC